MKVCPQFAGPTIIKLQFLQRPLQDPWLHLKKQWDGSYCFTVPLDHTASTTQCILRHTPFHNLCNFLFLLLVFCWLVYSISLVLLRLPFFGDPIFCELGCVSLVKTAELALVAYL